MCGIAKVFCWVVLVGHHDEPGGGCVWSEGPLSVNLSPLALPSRPMGSHFRHTWSAVCPVGGGVDCYGGAGGVL